ncbi:hypothetical protein D9615_006381 [Tricholomella constricta]|uniref:Uncharacterized protein n=1 Tax=Tricholomella constricta TaxID=117010 RepID=A0A8H5M1F7_9AGAR|nr:hypothetical protein D9615_006381 [Tricholomella constricta]
MWCTRWFLPLLLLPLPTAPPYFLLLFLFSLTMHAKPCFYCIVLLTTLFVSSCYWQPFPLDSPLSTPWSDNITTFAEALNSTLALKYSRPLPNVMRAVDRCWCDFSAGGFFEPFNVTHWEYVSVQRLKDDFEHQQKVDEAALKQKETLKDVSASVTPSHNDTMPRTPAPGPSSTSIPLKSAKISSRDIRSILRLFHYALKGESTPSPSPSADTPTPRSSVLDAAMTPMPSPPPCSEEKCPLIRKEYDLRPYGLGILVDFGWTR